MDGTHIVQKSPHVELVCDLSSFSPDDREQYHDLRAQLRNALISSNSIHSGYVLRLYENRISMEQIAEWIRLENLCCPWLFLNVKRGEASFLEVRIEAPRHAMQVLQIALGELLVKGPSSNEVEK